MPKRSARVRPVRQTQPLGVRLQRVLDACESAATARRPGAALLGAALALAVVLGGLGAFVVVWALLVGVIR
jgi:hypothetical protein